MKGRYAVSANWEDISKGGGRGGRGGEKEKRKKLK